MELRLGKTRICVHPLMLMMPLTAWMLGLRWEIAALLISLSVHELSHLLGARMMGVGIAQIRLMPFGGAAYIGNPYALSAAQLMITSLAGPLGNLLALLLCTALTHWQVIPPPFALAMLQANLVLMLFNLLPALPLDGGRMLYAALFPHVGRARAVDAGILLGRALAILLLTCAVFAWLTHGMLNLSLVFAAIFLLAAAPEERRALADTRVQTLLNGLKPLSAPIPVNLCAVDGTCPVRTALRAASPNALTLYAVYADGRLTGFTDDRRLLNLALKENLEAPVSES